MADQAEQWTRQELRRARRAGWKVVNGLRIRHYGDVDTVAVGPPGVVVVETKWSSEAWSSSRQQRWIAAAVVQASGNAALVGRLIQQEIGPVPVWAVVVLWPSDPAVEVEAHGGVTVLSGFGLWPWVASLDTAGLSLESVDAAWQFLDWHAARRDAHDLEQKGREPRSAARYLIDLLQYLVGAWGGLYAVAWLFHSLRWPVALALGVVADTVLSLGSRVQSIRPLFVAAFVAIGSGLTAFAVVAAAQAAF
jgi:hypothetical protein